MNKISRRKVIRASLAATAGGAGLVTAAKLSTRHGLVPPDHMGIFGPGETLTYASHRLLVGDSLAREFSRDRISTAPFANGRPPADEAFQALQAGGFAEWRLQVEGLVARPASLSLAELRSHPVTNQITQLTCEEGWNFIAEWTGVRLSHILNVAEILPQARYVVYDSIQEYWRDSIDIAEALHPQTLLTYGMNGRDLPVGHGGPLRLRVPRQLGYKSVKYITRLTVTDTLKGYWQKTGYAWYAGI